MALGAGEHVVLIQVVDEPASERRLLAGVLQTVEKAKRRSHVDAEPGRVEDHAGLHLPGDPLVGITELEAKRFELNYVKLAGNIGVMVNGAGLALSTIDLLKEQGGEPADFMDVRSEATRDQIAGGFGLLLRNPRVEAILVNIYGGGILRCDTVAEGIGAELPEPFSVARADGLT